MAVIIYYYYFQKVSTHQWMLNGSVRDGQKVKKKKCDAQPGGPGSTAQGGAISAGYERWWKRTRKDILGKWGTWTKAELWEDLGEVRASGRQTCGRKGGCQRGRQGLGHLPWEPAGIFIKERDVSDVGFLLQRKFLWTDNDIMRLCKSKNSSPHFPKPPGNQREPSPWWSLGF